jgi:DNA-binding NarL/FixJ family response regulator
VPLAVSGLTNKKIAAQLFISPKTVQTNLANVYDKLGVHSRAQLATRMTETAAPPPTSVLLPDR